MKHWRTEYNYKQSREEGKKEQGVWKRRKKEVFNGEKRQIIIF